MFRTMIVACEPVRRLIHEHWDNNICVGSHTFEIEVLNSDGLEPLRHSTPVHPSQDILFGVLSS